MQVFHDNDKNTNSALEALRLIIRLPQDSEDGVNKLAQDLDEKLPILLQNPGPFQVSAT